MTRLNKLEGIRVNSTAKCGAKLLRMSIIEKSIFRNKQIDVSPNEYEQNAFLRNIYSLLKSTFFFPIDVAREVTFLSISWLKSKRHWRADMAKFITTRTLLIRVKMFLKNAVDWSFNYLCDSLSVISWLHSCNEWYQLFEDIDG